MLKKVLIFTITFIFLSVNIPTEAKTGYKKVLQINPSQEEFEAEQLRQKQELEKLEIEKLQEEKEKLEAENEKLKMQIYTRENENNTNIYNYYQTYPYYPYRFKRSPYYYRNTQRYIPQQRNRTNNLFGFNFGNNINNNTKLLPPNTQKTNNKY